MRRLVLGPRYGGLLKRFDRCASQAFSVASNRRRVRATKPETTDGVGELSGLCRFGLFAGRIRSVRRPVLSGSRVRLHGDEARGTTFVGGVVSATGDWHRDLGDRDRLPARTRVQRQLRGADVARRRGRDRRVKVGFELSLGWRAREWRTNDIDAELPHGCDEGRVVWTRWRRR